MVALHGASVLGFPIAGLLAQLQVFALQGADFVAEVRHVVTHLLRRSQPISLPAAAGRSSPYAVHDRNCCRRTPALRPADFQVKTGSSKVHSRWLTGRRSRSVLLGARSRNI